MFQFIDEFSHNTISINILLINFYISHNIFIIIPYYDINYLF